MPNILDAEDSYLNAHSLVRKWAAEFLQKWTEPLDEMQLMLWWGKQNPEMHHALSRLAPEAYQKVKEKVQQIEERSKRWHNP